MEVAQKGGYDHFMLKEIHEQVQVARELLHLLDDSEDVEEMVQQLQSARHIYLVGCGTSYHACMLGSVYFSRLAGVASFPVLAPQFIAQFGPAVGPEDVGIFVSQSGETKDVLNAIEAAEAKGMKVLGLVNVVGSTLERVSAVHLPLVCGYEISVPATKTYMNQALSLLYVALRLGGHDTGVLDAVPDLIEQTIEMTLPQMDALEPVLVNRSDLYCLGYGLTYPVALEGALKLKEITYAHCEGMLSTEFKHGPLSAVDDGYPVIFSAVEEDVPLIVSGINEVTCRGGYAIAVGQEDERLRANADHMVTIPAATPELSALIAVIPLQLLSYRLSVALGYDPDFPRNLSKTLTVD
jgi:glucosamine--fructose-6-phosphate aminotransferase (isomerizing)